MSKHCRGKQRSGVLRFGSGARDRWQICDPEGEELEEAMHRMRYEPMQVTQDHIWAVLDACEGYLHLTTYPLGTEHVIRKLRKIRRMLKERSQ